ncbi:hypothetical protein L227DRAFT_658447 [Lentinus tigrinus ALCF2SS1-6]|uniref:Uncharacterized protein n=1 Tax=Lentinus tigrinus ALCF2SS1-6 TaxID=1328759 RepID=A0A5C2RQ59_9APHY|nr:hypothetical protein L227DRAFT_658447 [Lentinus tigrinus ALCF2SS1-6]
MPSISGNRHRLAGRIGENSNDASMDADSTGSHHELPKLLLAIILRLVYRGVALARCVSCKGFSAPDSEDHGVPSADAYSALILHVKDTTDDTSNTMALFKESQSLGVVPNIFMYNTVISKLVKARKADSIVEHARRSVYGDAARTSVPDGFCVRTSTARLRLTSEA